MTESVEFDDEAHPVGSTADVSPHSPHITDVEDTTVVIFEVDGEYYALDNQCPHQGGPLGEGKIEDGNVYCPWHGWQFDVDTGEHGQGICDATSYDVVCDGDNLAVRL